jgi:hypothetical protein
MLSIIYLHGTDQDSQSCKVTSISLKWKRFIQNTDLFNRRMTCSNESAGPSVGRHVHHCTRSSPPHITIVSVSTYEERGVTRWWTTDSGTSMSQYFRPHNSNSIITAKKTMKSVDPENIRSLPIIIREMEDPNRSEGTRDRRIPLGHQRSFVGGDCRRRELASV